MAERKWRWAACSITEFGHVGEERHLVAEGSLVTWCGHSATTPEIWRANTRKPKCKDCAKQETRLLATTVPVAEKPQPAEPVEEHEQTTVARGQIWRRRKNGRLVRVTRVENVSRGSAPYYDVAWETVAKPFRRGQSYEDYWYKNCEYVEGMG